jgi:hypothetical protein
MIFFNGKNKKLNKNELFSKLQLITEVKKVV